MTIIEIVTIIRMVKLKKKYFHIKKREIKIFYIINTLA